MTEKLASSRARSGKDFHTKDCGGIKLREMCERNRQIRYQDKRAETDKGGKEKKRIDKYGSKDK